MKTAKRLISILLLLIGLIHIGVSFTLFSALSSEALWFVSGGLVLIFSGFFNLFLCANGDTDLKKISYLRIVNLILFLFLVLMVIQLPMIPGFIGLGCTLFLLLFNHGSDRLSPFS
ncbi:MAG: hypothetical protein AAF824_19030 [Bacteroidota bacterium]